jgi:hypothetical protein
LKVCLVPAQVCFKLRRKPCSNLSEIFNLQRPTTVPITKAAIRVCAWAHDNIVTWIRHVGSWWQQNNNHVTFWIGWWIYPSVTRKVRANERVDTLGDLNTIFNNKLNIQLFDSATTKYFKSSGDRESENFKVKWHPSLHAWKVKGKMYRYKFIMTMWLGRWILYLE